MLVPNYLKFAKKTKKLIKTLFSTSLDPPSLVRNMYQMTALEAVSVREEKSHVGIQAVIQMQNALSKMDRENVSVKMVTKVMDTGNVHKV